MGNNLLNNNVKFCKSDIIWPVIFKEITSIVISICKEIGRYRVHEKVNINGVKERYTDIDKKIESEIIRYIKNKAPWLICIGEESIKGSAKFASRNTFFVVDPIDGTEVFLSGGKEWAVSCCYVENNEPHDGMLYFPLLNELWTSHNHRGLYLNGKKCTKLNASTQNIAVSPRQINNPIFQDKILETRMNPIKVSALTPKIRKILRGEADAAVYFAQKNKNAKLWDYAAANLLIKEFGGSIHSLLDGKELPYCLENLVHIHGWVAFSSKSICSRTLPILIS